MFARQAVALVLIAALAFPAWGNPSIVGNAARSQSATVRGTALTPGSTIFSGDAIEVGPSGSAWITLPGGAQVYIAQNSLVYLAKTEDTTQLVVDRGAVSFRTTEKSRVEALLADATIRSVNDMPAVGSVAVRNPQSALIAAEKGMLVITTEHNASSVTLREGEGAEVVLRESKDNDEPKGKDPEEEKKKKRRRGGAIVLPAGSWSLGKVVLISAIIGGAVTCIALCRGDEPSHTVPDNCNAVSPFRCP